MKQRELLKYLGGLVMLSGYLVFTVSYNREMGQIPIKFLCLRVKTIH